MNKIMSFTIASAVGMLLSAAPAFAQDQDHAAYKSMIDKAGVDYKAAKAQCGSSSGNAKKVCIEDAKVARARAESDAVAQHMNTPRDLSKARVKVADAEYDLAKAKCRDSSDRANCVSQAKSAKVAAVADAKAGNQMAGVGTPAMRDQRSAATTGAMENCAQMETAEKAACMARRAAGTAKNVVADTVITSKIKADLVKEPDLKAMDVHVETDKGVVMLSGFVPSQAQADKAVQLARSVEGVVDVKSALKTSK
ncbi:MAG TPA: BON domain-containing protein [Janthinobacterium sp.]|nr:BON domain-containing protein [Janthinobacterium sp.]